MNQNNSNNKAGNRQSTSITSALGSLFSYYSKRSSKPPSSISTDNELGQPGVDDADNPMSPFYTPSEQELYDHTILTDDEDHEIDWGM
jgi:hypothetical protein